VALSAEEADELLRALAHPARRAILQECWREPRSAGALSETVGLAAASTSEHLKVLRKIGLVVLTKDGTFRWYRADPARVAALAEWLSTFP
jgi:DNA-binding transcriptional ArsR family regulator